MKYSCVYNFYINVFWPNSPTQWRGNTIETTPQQSETAIQQSEFPDYRYYNEVLVIVIVYTIGLSF